MNAGLTNFHNYFAAIYEARYVSGVVAGLKLNEMIESGKITADAAKMGYVGAFPFAEVISGFTSFYLGARSVCPTVTMEVRYTNSWGDMAMEKETAEALIADGCVLISQHADTTGARTACEAALRRLQHSHDSRRSHPGAHLLRCQLGCLLCLRHPERAGRHHLPR